MKKLFILTILAVAAFATSITASASHASVSMKGDSLVIIDGTDTLVLPTATVFIEQVKSRLNDTVVGGRAVASEEGVGSSAAQDAADSEYQAKLDYNLQFDRQEKLQIMIITGIVFSAIVLMVFLCLIFFYMHRRAKYRMIEKAIENNYELPMSVAGAYPRQYQQPAPQMSEPIQPQPAMPKQPPMFAQGAPVYPNHPHTSWSNDVTPGQFYLPGFRNALCWTVTGLMGVLFFLSVGGEPVAFLFGIPLIVGLYKGAVEYLKQRNRIIYENYQMNNGLMGGNLPSGGANEPDDDQPTPPPFSGSNSNPE
ncbi:MAG: hypothetical protein ACI308_10375 [Muribaculaceae bacterium]